MIYHDLSIYKKIQLKGSSTRINQTRMTQPQRRKLEERQQDEEHQIIDSLTDFQFEHGTPKTSKNYQKLTLPPKLLFHKRSISSGWLGHFTVLHAPRCGNYDAPRTGQARRNYKRQECSKHLRREKKHPFRARIQMSTKKFKGAHLTKLFFGSPCLTSIFRSLSVPLHSLHPLKFMVYGLWLTILPPHDLPDSSKN